MLIHDVLMDCITSADLPLTHFDRMTSNFATLLTTRINISDSLFKVVLLSQHLNIQSLIGCPLALAGSRGSSFINQIQTNTLKPSKAIKY